MRRLFIQFYVMVFVCFVIAALFMGGIYQFTAERVSNRYLEGLVQDFLDRFSQELAQLPPAQWPAEVAAFSHRLNLDVQMGALTDQPLAADDLHFLETGNIVIVEDDATFRQRVPGADRVLIIGPVPYLHFQHELRWLIIGLLVILGLSLAIPILLWMRPHWRDMQQLEKAAQRLGSGKLDARAALPASSSLATLGTTFDQMAVRLQGLIAGRKQLTDAIAHELRTPLVRLRYRLAMLESPLPEPELTPLEHDIEAIEFLIDEMLTYSRLNEPGLTITRGDIELRQWVKARLSDWTAQGTGQTISLSVPDTPLWWQGDQRLLDRAMDNLVGNALRYARHEIVVSIAPQGSQIAITVADDGPGIAAEQADRIFEPFVRLDESRNRRTGGIGLGLAIVRSIVQVHGGSIALKPGRGGAHFELLLPVQSDTNRHQSPTEQR